jgi:hypothetical protein
VQLTQAEFFARQMGTQLIVLFIQLQPLIKEPMCKVGTFDDNPELRDAIRKLHWFMLHGRLEDWVLHLREQELEDENFEFRHWEDRDVGYYPPVGIIM